MYTAPIESNKKKKEGEEEEENSLYLSVNLISTKVLIGDTIFYVSYWRRDRHFTWSSEPREVLLVAGQGMYLHFSVILRPWVLVRPREPNPRPSALQWSALPAELALPRVPFVFLRSFRSVFSVIGLLQWAVISSIFLNSHMPERLGYRLAAWKPQVWRVSLWICANQKRN